jgi:hypothetical protein
MILPTPWKDASMKTLLLATALLAAPALTHRSDVAASPISRCGAGGTVIYTDRACHAIGAQALPMSGELIRNLARAAASDPIDAPLPGQVDPAQRQEQEAARAYLAARHGDMGCARTPTQLSLQLRGAIAMGDVNRIAASYDWAGMRSEQARGVLAKLEGLGKAPVVGAHFYDATIGETALGMMAPVALRTGGSAGYLQLVQDGGASVTEFDVHRVAGCYFVSF